MAAERQYNASCLSKSQGQDESSTQQMVNIDVGDNITILEIDEKGWARGKKISVEIDESEQQQAGESADFWFPLERLFPSKLDQFASKVSLQKNCFCCYLVLVLVLLVLLLIYRFDLIFYQK